MTPRVHHRPANEDPAARDRLLTQGASEGLIVAKTTDLYLAYLPDGTLVGMSGFLWRRSTVTFKNRYVLPPYRLQGYMREMLDWSIEQARARGYPSAEATCTPSGVHEYLRRGADVVRRYKNGTTHVRLRFDGNP